MCSLLQILVLAIWVILIIRSALKTGKALRKEPFLSTRPAQLVFRILMSMIILAAASFIIRFAVDISWRLRNWEVNQHFIDASGCEDDNEMIQSKKSENFECWGNNHISMNILFRSAMHAKLRITFINTATNLGAGKILYVTVCTLIVSFIFLPSTYLNPLKVERIESGELIGREYQRGDKRYLLSLGKNTHTWRVFPMPISKEGTTLRQRQHFVDHLEVDKYLQLKSNQWGAGTIYKNI